MKAFEGKTFYGLTLLMMAADFVCFQASLVIGYWFWITFPWHGNWQYFSDFLPIVWALPVVALIVFQAIGLYKPEMGVIGVEEQSLIFKGIWSIYFFVFAVSFFYRESEFSRLATFYSMFVSLWVISIERFAMRHLFAWFNRQGIANRHALIYGAGYHGQRLERWIHQSPKLGIRVLGFLDDDISKLVKKPDNLPVFGDLKELKKLKKKREASILFIAHRGLKEHEIIEVYQLCRELEIECWSIPSLYQFHIERAELQNIGGIPLVSFRKGFVRSSYMVTKRVLDILIASTLLFLLSPILLAIWVSLRIDSKQSPIFRQVRIGQDHRKFTMFKFRTLKSGTKEHEISPELSKKSKIINPFAGLLRKSGLDELPQLVNVIQGDMSLVGPRPEMPFLVEKYGPLERERLTVKPGMTGLWQISDDRKRLLIHENMDYDLYYLEHLSFNLDLAIIVKTCMVIAKRLLEKGPALVERRKQPRR
ncbi:MAG: exopolysaccharide biosynthesis polyprenyl glycosylphosphotransferase [Candidatus Omnitrophica bacterium]|nr:exopolysaccharide biosynthesis polyprenyl glycosylphosphotransferase [Candidatus Omnitrophota bacterium]